MTDRDEARHIAETILNQLGGVRAITLMTGAAQFVYLNETETRRGGVMFKMRGRNAPGLGNIVTVELNGRDLYDVTIARSRGLDTKTTMERTDVFVADLKEAIEQGTGRILTVPTILRR